MKWLRFLLLLGVVFAFGCSSGSSGSGEEAAPPAVGDADPAAAEPAATEE